MYHTNMEKHFFLKAHFKITTKPIEIYTVVRYLLFCF